MSQSAPGEEGGDREHAGRWLRVLSREEFTRMMSTAVESALIERGTLMPARARLLSRDALQRFAGLVRRRSRRVRGLSRSDFLREFERSHGALVRDRQRLQGQVSQLEGQLHGARDGMSNGSAEAPSAELEAALRADLEVLLASPEPRVVLEEVLRRERERREQALARALEPERARIDLLERRLTKLRAALANQERELAELARRAAIDLGVPSIYREVQGLGGESSGREAKTELLTRIFEQNYALQKGR